MGEVPGTELKESDRCGGGTGQTFVSGGRVLESTGDEK